MSLDHRAPYEAIGGEIVLRRMTQIFYDTMETDAPEIARLHELDEQGKVSARARQAFWRFLCFWTGGPDDYLETYGHPRLGMRHMHFKVDAEARDAWLHCMKVAMDGVGLEGDVRNLLDARFKHVGTFLQNSGPRGERYSANDRQED